MRQKINNLWLGLLLGLIIPLAFGYFYIHWTFKGILTTEELITVVTDGAMIIKFLFIATLPNMFAVFVLNAFEMWKMCRGVFIAIFLYMIASVPFIG